MSNTPMHLASSSKIEFSKLIFWLVWTTNAVVIVSALFVLLYGLFRNGYADTTPLIYLIPSTAAELATASGFYYNKSKSENRLKLAKDLGIKVDENTIYSYIN